jgi:hypothetical protein
MIRCGLVALALLGGLPARAAAQPDWLPPGMGKKRPRPTPAAAAAEDPCADPLLEAPLAPALRDTGLDRTRGACLSSAVDTRARGAAAVDRPEFYGTLAGSLFVERRFLLLPDLELQAGARAVDHRFAQDAVVTASETALGPVWLGATIGDRRRPGGRLLRLAYGLRFELPYTDSNYIDTPVVAARPEAAAALALARTLALHGRLAGLLWLARPPDDVDTRRALVASTDLVWAPWRVLAIGAGVEAQAGWYESGLDHLLVRGGLRAPLGCRVRIDLAAAAPVAGEERTDLVVELGAHVDL